MAQRRRRHPRRNVLVFLGSLAAHVALFALVARELTIPYRLPELPAPAVQLELVPEPVVPVPPPPPQPEIIPRPQPPAPQPTPQPQPQPEPVPAPPEPSPKIAVQRTAPVRTTASPAPIPAPNPAQLATPLAPPMAAPQPGPPEAVPHAPVAVTQPHVIAAPTLKLHKSNELNASPLAPPVSIPGAVFAPPAQPGGQAAAGAGAPGGGAAGRLPGGVLPGFGGGLRGSLLGCIDSAVAKLSAEEQARCAERLGEGAKIAPVMDPIGATQRGALNDEATREQAAQKYRDNTTPGNVEHTIPGQPRIFHQPGE